MSGWISWCRPRQRYWQVLPLGPTSFGDSPYQSYSAFAGEPLYIDLDQLAEAGLLKKGACKRVEWGEDPSHVDYDVVRTGRKNLLRKAFKNFEDKKALEAFRQENAEWVEDYALYMALKDKNKGRPWTEWKKGLRLRDPAALEECREKYKEDVDYYVFTQYLFFQQWGALKEYANQRGVKIIGDAPIYVALDSADVWASPEQFQLDEQGRAHRGGRLPPGRLLRRRPAVGQPPLRLGTDEAGRLLAGGCSRIRPTSLPSTTCCASTTSGGSSAYYAIPYGDTTARNGRWRPGPGMDFFRAVNQRAGERQTIIAEDLGFLTPAVPAPAGRYAAIPGMKVLQFAFDTRRGAAATCPTATPTNCVVYTGTHDNTTTRGWLDTQEPEVLQLAKDYLGFEAVEDGPWAFIRGALESVADLAVIPLQDYLGLGGECRINTPSTVGGTNWRWRMSPEDMDEELAGKMARLSLIYGRASKSEPGKGPAEEPAQKAGKSQTAKPGKKAGKAAKKGDKSHADA